jgi:hypothetical protein
MGCALPGSIPTRQGLAADGAIQPAVGGRVGGDWHNQKSQTAAEIERPSPFFRDWAFPAIVNLGSRPPTRRPPDRGMPNRSVFKPTLFIRWVAFAS